MASTSNKTSNGTWQKATPVSCMDCKHSCLIQPGNKLFPYQREVAKAMKVCIMHRHTDEVKQIQKRTAA